MDHEWVWWENQAPARRLKSARLRRNACIEDIDYRATRGLEKGAICGLAKDSKWMKNHEKIFVLGPTGVGKGLHRLRSGEGVPPFGVGAGRWKLPLSAGAADRIDAVVIDDWSELSIT